MIDTIKNVGIFLFASTTLLFIFKLFSYIYAFIGLTYNIISIIGVSCATHTIITTATTLGLIGFLTTYLYTRWLK